MAQLAVGAGIGLVFGIVFGLVFGMAGCERGLPDTDAGAEVSSAQPLDASIDEFTTAEALRDHLCTMATVEDCIAMLDLVYTEQRVAQATVQWHRGILGARLEFARAMNDRFAGADGEVMAADLGLGELVAAMCAAPLVEVNPVQVRARYELPDGTEQQLVLERRGTWKVHVSTLNGGDDVNDVWFFNQQFRFGAITQYHRDVAAALREGAFASPDEARARLAELLAGPPPRLGSVVP